MLRDDDRVPAGVRGICFFDAAALVTGPSALGRLQRLRWLMRLLERIGLLDPGACRHLERISAWLLRRNLDIVRRLLLEWRELRSPLAPYDGRLSARAFDDAMVVYEQCAIDEYIARHDPPPAARRGIDLLLALASRPRWRALSGVDDELGDAVLARFRQASRSPSFFCIDTRIAIGQSLVRRLRARADGSLRGEGSRTSSSLPATRIPGECQPASP